ncbi:MAG: erythromycin esterase family protein [Tissierellia bacterium]|nr:erythromycin esterase family protein [Tissierellia bacterium]
MTRFKVVVIAVLLLVLAVALGPKNYQVEPAVKTEAEKALENEIVQYLKDNYNSIDLDNEIENFHILDEDLEGKEIFFTGEVHGIKTNADLHMKFLKYFKEKVDFKYYLAEFSYSNAYFLNKYLNTGDIRILEDVFEELKGSYSWNKDSFEFWVNFQQYNNNLEEERKIQVIGIDIELQPSTSYKYFVDILPSEDPPIEIKKMINNIINTNNRLIETGFGASYSTAKDLQKDIIAKESIYRDYLGEHYFGFKTVSSNLLKYERAYRNKRNQVDWNNLRDKMIYENFVLIERRMPKGKYFGQWGVNHVFQSKEKNIKWLATYLNEEDSMYKDKVLSIAFNYENSRQMGKMGDKQYIINEVDFIFPYMKVANDRIGGDMNIYKLNAAGSPFKDIRMYYTFNRELLEEPMVNFFQYIVYLKDIGPTDPLGY